MLQYLVILLDDTSTSYCHYTNSKKEHHLISVDDLKAGILFGMKENLMIQYVYPSYKLPQEYEDVIESIDHSKIMPIEADTSNADVIVFDHLIDTIAYSFEVSKTYVLRISKNELFSQKEVIKNLFDKVTRLNIVINDIDKFTDDDFHTYKVCLKEWAERIEDLFIGGGSPQISILTDRMILNDMNNCGAGETTIVLAPNGKFYICPAFYLSEPCDGTEASLDTECTKGYSVGTLADGLDVKNPQLYKISHAPLCRKCDAYQCRRCIWLNRKTTLEVNTPSHEQCVIAHLERNASRELLISIRKHGTFLPEKEIKEITYLDPFDVRDEW